MKRKIKYLTDTGSSFYTDHYGPLGIDCIPLQIGVDNKNYLDMKEYNVDQLYVDMLEKKQTTTSMSPFGMLDEYFEQCAKQKVDLVIACPICPGISGNYDAMIACAKQHSVPIWIINNYVTAYLQQYLIESIKKCMDANMPVEKVQGLIDATIDSANTLMVPDDLRNLTKSGRLTPTAAKIGNLLKITPILKINKETNGRIDALSMVRTSKRAISNMCDIIKETCTDSSYVIYITHVNYLAKALDIKNNYLEGKVNGAQINVVPLCTPVSVHLGLNGIAIQVFKRCFD